MDHEFENIDINNFNSEELHSSVNSLSNNPLNIEYDSTSGNDGKKNNTQQNDSYSKGKCSFIRQSTLTKLSWTDVTSKLISMVDIDVDLDHIEDDLVKNANNIIDTNSSNEDLFESDNYIIQSFKYFFINHNVSNCELIYHLGYDDLEFINGIITMSDLETLAISEDNKIQLLEVVKSLPNPPKFPDIPLIQASADLLVSLCRLPDYLEDLIENDYNSAARIALLWDVPLSMVIHVNKIGHKKRFIHYIEIIQKKLAQHNQLLDSLKCSVSEDSLENTISIDNDSKKSVSIYPNNDGNILKTSKCDLSLLTTSDSSPQIRFNSDASSRSIANIKNIAEVILPVSTSISSDIVVEHTISSIPTDDIEQCLIKDLDMISCKQDDVLGNERADKLQNKIVDLKNVVLEEDTSSRMLTMQSQAPEKFISSRTKMSTVTMKTVTKFSLANDNRISTFFSKTPQHIPLAVSDKSNAKINSIKNFTSKFTPNKIIKTFRDQKPFHAKDSSPAKHEDVLIKADVNYFGLQIVPNLSEDGPSMVNPVISKFKIAYKNIVKVPAISFILTNNKVSLNDHSGNPMCEYEIKNTFYCSQDVNDLKLLSFVCFDTSIKKYVCQVIKCNCENQCSNIALSFRNAFKIDP